MSDIKKENVFDQLKLRGFMVITNLPQDTAIPMFIIFKDLADRDKICFKEESEDAAIVAMSNFIIGYDYANRAILQFVDQSYSKVLIRGVDI